MLISILIAYNNPRIWDDLLPNRMSDFPQLSQFKYVITSLSVDIEKYVDSQTAGWS